MKSENNASGGVGVTGLLSVALIVLKLCGVIDWSWWWVLAPIWISAVIVVLFFIGFFVFIAYKKAKDK